MDTIPTRDSVVSACCKKELSHTLVLLDVLEEFVNNTLIHPSPTTKTLTQILQINALLIQAKERIG